jgi:non-ribosomal peptide synthetase component F/tetratricopeptide (TPR) repeat protein/pimeloyl-ACP methyl ester carboxylesterase
MDTEESLTEAEKVFIHVFEEQALQSPGQVILEYQGLAWTYAQINEQANQLAAYLAKHVKAKECYTDEAPRVGLFLRQSPEAIIAILATMKAGIAHVPLDFQRPASQLRHMIADTGLTLIVTDVDDRELAVNALKETSEYKNVTTVDFNEAVKGVDDQVVSSERVRADTLAYVIYSSGSTSKPKGIAIPHGQLLDNAGALSAVLGDDDKVTKDSHIGGYTVLGFDASLFDMLMAFKVGACLHIIPQETRFDPPLLKDFFRDKQISHVVLLPPVMEKLADLGESALQELSALKVICATGEAFSPALVDRWQGLLPHTLLINGYGPTEAVISAMISEPLASLRETGGDVPIGKVRRGLESRLLSLNFVNEEHEPPADLQDAVNRADISEQAVLQGEEGELFLVGRHLGRYWGDNQEANKLNRQRLARLSDGRTMYRTFDGAMNRRDGNYCYTKRLDNQLKVRGVLITLEAVDDELQKACRTGVDMSAFGLSSEADYINHFYAAAQPKSDVNNDHRLYFNIVISDPQLRGALSEHDNVLFQHLINEIDDVLVEEGIQAAMRPNAYRLLSHAQETENNKLKRKYAIDEADLNLFSPQGLDQSRPDPGDVLAHELVALWSEDLNVDQAEINLGDNYEVLGGSSITIMPMLRKVKARHSAFEANMQVFRKDPSINGLMRQICRQQLNSDNVLLEKFPGETNEDSPGTSQPIIFVHALFGSAEDDYRDLLPLLKENNPNAPIAVINSPGLTDPKAMPGTLKELAQYYVDLLKQKYPRKACWLIGWSSGGSIAHTMASLMREEQVAGVIMIDTQCLSYTNQMSRKDYFKRMVDAVNYDYFREKVGYKGEKINVIAEKHNVFKKQSLKRQTAGFMTYLENQWHFLQPQAEEEGFVLPEAPEFIERREKFVSNTQCMLNLLMHYDAPKKRVKKAGLLVAEMSHEQLRGEASERQRRYLGWVKGEEVFIDRKTLLKREAEDRYHVEHDVVIKMPEKVAEAIKHTMNRLKPTKTYHLHARNQYFTGREEALVQVAQNLKEDKFSVITGLEGVGKTDMANRFMQDMRDFGEIDGVELGFDLILSLDASDLSRSLLDVASTELGDQLALKLFEVHTANAFVERVMNILIEKYSKILVYLDAVEKEEDVCDFVESAREKGCSVFVTSRNDEWQNVVKIKSENGILEAFAALPSQCLLMSADMEKYCDAIKGFQQARTKNPDKYKPLFTRDAIEEAFERHEHEIDDLNREMGINPDEHQGYFNQVNYKIEPGDYEGAQEDFTRQVAKEAFDQEIMMSSVRYSANLTQGGIRAELGEYEEAIDRYSQAIAINPDKHEGYLYRGVAKAKLGKHDDAIVDYNQAIAINSVTYEGYLNRGVSNVELGKHQDAIADFGRAIVINSNRYDGYLNRGILNLGLGNYNKAIVDCDLAIVINPGRYECHFNRGASNAELGKHEEAILDYNQAIVINPNVRRGYLNRGISKIEVGDYKEAKEDFDAAIKQDPKNAEIYQWRGFVKMQLKDYSDAITDFKLGLEFKPDDIWLKEHLEEAKELLVKQRKPYPGMFIHSVEEEDAMQYDERGRLSP